MATLIELIIHHGKACEELGRAETKLEDAEEAEDDVAYAIAKALHKEQLDHASTALQKIRDHIGQ